MFANLQAYKRHWVYDANEILIMMTVTKQKESINALQQWKMLGKLLHQWCNCLRLKKDFLGVWKSTEKRFAIWKGKLRLLRCKVRLTVVITWRLWCVGAPWWFIRWIYNKMEKKWENISIVLKKFFQLWLSIEKIIFAFLKPRIQILIFF